MSTIPYRVSGAGPTVLLIHGNAPDFFEALEAELVHDHRVVRLDRRGFGKSGLSATRTLTQHAQDIAAIIDALGDNEVVLVGWSHGGVIALEAALLREKQVRGLVLLEPSWLFRRHPTLHMYRVIIRAMLQAAFGDPAAGAEHFLRWVLTRRDGRCDVDNFSEDDRQRMRESSAGIVRGFGQSTGEHIARRVKQPLKWPIRLLIGDDSPPEFGRAAQRLAERLAIEPRVIHGAGHFLQQTHAAQVAESVRSITAV